MLHIEQLLTVIYLAFKKDIITKEPIMQGSLKILWTQNFLSAQTVGNLSYEQETFSSFLDL